jgi:citrate synthase
MSRLIDELMNVHAELAGRENFSSLLVGQCASSEKDYISSIAAALLTLGGRHGPTEQTVNFLTAVGSFDPRIYYQHKLMIPGWGSAFIKGEPDPHFDTLDGYLFEDNTHIWKKIKEVTTKIHNTGKILYPNAACYTAAVAITEGIPAEVSPYLLIKGRLDTWTSIYLQNKGTRLP